MTSLSICSIGCDPEIFMQDVEGKIRSAIGKFGGTKEKPEPIASLGEGFAVQEDNILMEFNIPPAKTSDEFVQHVHRIMGVLSLRAKKQGLSFAKGSAYSVDPAELEHPKAKVFGCDPDFNAYTGKQNPSPHAPDPNLRSAGGHIAFGFECFNKKLPFSAEQLSTAKNNLVQLMDIFLGIPSLLLDKGELRKQLYGKAGAYRPKSYGVEYRTLSNFWVFDSKITKVLLDNLKRRLDAVYLESYLTETHPYSSLTQMVELAINTNNKDFAQWMFRRYTHLYSSEVLHAVRFAERV